MNIFKDTINFSLWCDFIERDFLENDFKKMVDERIIQGATSNPDIFKNAISTSNAYEQQVNMLQANSPKKIYEEISTYDIKKAAKILKPLHDADDTDGFISLEVDPMLCNNAKETIIEGERLYSEIKYDNLMIKIPATKAGYIAMEHLTSLGISVNATLVFSPNQAIQCAKALESGIEKSNKNTKAVISIFVSRFDRLLDKELTSFGMQKYKIGIINATKCYHEIEKIKNKNIRTLFASTGIKDDNMPKSYYIDNLIFPNSINTAPLVAIDAWKKNEKRKISIILEEKECDKYFKMLEDINIDINIAYDKLLKDGLSAFAVSFKDLLKKVKL